MYTRAQLKAAHEAHKQAERSRLPWPERVAATAK
jgi:hypothetical protein